MGTKRTSQLAVSKRDREVVYARDSFGYPPYPCCCTCGSPGRHDMSHYIKRSQGGKGIPENLVNQCRECHNKMEHGLPHEREVLLSMVEEHLQSHYPGWSKEILTYKKEQIA